MSTARILRRIRLETFGPATLALFLLPAHALAACQWDTELQGECPPAGKSRANIALESCLQQTAGIADACRKEAAQAKDLLSKADLSERDRAKAAETIRLAKDLFDKNARLYADYTRLLTEELGKTTEEGDRDAIEGELQSVHHFIRESDAHLDFVRGITLPKEKPPALNTAEESITGKVSGAGVTVGENPKTPGSSAVVDEPRRDPAESREGPDLKPSDNAPDGSKARRTATLDQRLARSTLAGSASTAKARQSMQNMAGALNDPKAGAGDDGLGPRGSRPGAASGAKPGPRPPAGSPAPAAPGAGDGPALSARPGIGSRDIPDQGAAHTLESLLAQAGVATNLRDLPEAVVREASRKAQIIFIDGAAKRSDDVNKTPEDNFDAFLRSVVENLKKYRFVLGRYDPKNPLFRDIEVDESARQRVLRWSRSCGPPEKCNDVAALKGILRYKKGGWVPMDVVDAHFKRLMGQRLAEFEKDLAAVEAQEGTPRSWTRQTGLVGGQNPARKQAPTSSLGQRVLGRMSKWLAGLESFLRPQGIGATAQQPRGATQPQPAQTRAEHGDLSLTATRRLQPAAAPPPPEESLSWWQRLKRWLKETGRRARAALPGGGG